MRRYLSILLCSMLLSACVPPAGQGATPTTVSPTAGATATKVSPTASATARTPAPTTIPVATSTTAPTLPVQETLAGAGGCDLLAKDQIEPIIGPLENTQDNSSVGEGSGYFAGCIYDGAAAYVIVSYGPIDGQPARDYYEEVLQQFDASQIEMLPELGGAAFWIQQDELSGQLYILSRSRKRQTRLVL